MRHLIAMLLAGGALTTATVDVKPTDVKVLATELSKGTVPSTSVYAVPLKDGGTIYASRYTKALPDAGFQQVELFLDSSPCAWKPLKTSVCTRLDGGDPGVRTTYDATALVGKDCSRKACVIYAGDVEP